MEFTFKKHIKQSMIHNISQTSSIKSFEMSIKNKMINLNYHVNGENQTYPDN